MDEKSYLRQIRASPGNTKLLRAYADWLSTNNDPRGEYLETELAFREAESQIEALRGRMYELTVVRGFDMKWLDAVHPIFVTAIAGGTFYHSVAPEKPPLVRIGEHVSPDTIVGILEVCTVPNQIAAGHHGYVSEFVAEHGQSVSSGEALIHLVRLPPA